MTQRERLGGWHSRWKEGNMSIYRDKNQSTDYGRGGEGGDKERGEYKAFCSVYIFKG